MLGQAAKPSGSGFGHVRFSLTFVLQIKTSKIINDVAKVSIKSEKIITFGGIFFVLDKFDSILSSVIDFHLVMRQTGWTMVEIGFQQYDVQMLAHEVAKQVRICAENHLYCIK